MKSHLPYIIIFDIDETLIGSINYLVKEYEIIENYLNEVKQKDINYENIKVDITDGLKDGVIRPFVKEFMDFCKTKYKNVEFFIYTNSSYDWTNEVIVNNIEDVLKIKFNKPYFTRENSYYNRKLLSNIYDDICKSLETKYKLLKDNKYKKQVFDNQLVFIDDRKDNLKDYTYKQIVCTKYNFCHYYNFEERIRNKYGLEIADSMLEILYERDIPVYNKNGNRYQQNLQYYKICEMIKERENYLNEKKKNDTFFRDLINIIKTNRIKIFNEENIKLINNRINANAN